jgi:hypothetical protein
MIINVAVTHILGGAIIRQEVMVVAGGDQVLEFQLPLQFSWRKFADNTALFYKVTVSFSWLCMWNAVVVWLILTEYMKSIFQFYGYLKFH